MDTKERLILKALTWQGLGFGVMLLIGWAFTGSFSAGGGIALVGAGTGVLAYMLHEMAWARVRWGQVPRSHRENE